MYDVVIVGAGPAGSILAGLLGNRSKKTYKIAIIDKRDLSQPMDPLRYKACGGLLSPDAQKMLAKLNLSLPVSVMEDPQFFKVRTIDFDNHLERSYQRFYYNMDREKFDRHLFSLIPNSVDTYCGVTINRIEKKETHWSLGWGVEAQNEIKARFLVAADGANSFVKRSLMPSSAPKPKSYISIQKWYPTKDHMPYYTRIFDTEITDYYSWVIQKSNHLIIGSALPLSLPKDKVHVQFDRLTAKVSDYLNIDLNTPLKTEGAFIERTQSLNQLLFGTRVKSGSHLLSIAFLGEAAGATSPTSAEGFSYAMDTAHKLFESLQEGLSGAEDRYDRRCNTIRLNIRFKLLKSPGMYHPPLRKLVMKSGITAMTDFVDSSVTKPIYLLVKPIKREVYTNEGKG